MLQFIGSSIVPLPHHFSNSCLNAAVLGLLIFGQEAWWNVKRYSMC